MSAHAIERCRGCHAPAGEARAVLRMDPMPLAGQFCESLAEAKAAEKYPLTWLRCERCGLVQVAEDVDDRLLFTRYSYASSTVPGLVRHFEDYARFLAERYSGGGVRLLEIGCNDGVLLRKLPESWTLVGFDPSDVAARAPSRRYALENVPFEPGAARALAGTIDVVTGSNCLAHVSDLRAVFEAAAIVLKPGGELLVEVHDLDATLALGQWDTIYHEHKAEWSERALAAVLAPLGLEAVRCDRLPLHGGLLRFVARKGRATTLPPPPLEDFTKLREGYLGRRETPVARALSDLKARGSRVFAYGASGRANVWLNQLPELPFDCIVDDAPLRVGRFLPCVGTPIVPSRELEVRAPDACLVTAWNYAREIRAKHPGFRGGWLQTFEERA